MMDISYKIENNIYILTKYYMFRHPLLSDIPVNFIRNKRIYIEKKTNTMLILSGFEWNGANWPAITTKTFIKASLVHDALYSLIRDNALPYEFREKSDKIMREICVADGMNYFRSWYVYWAVRLFGGAYAK